MRDPNNLKKVFVNNDEIEILVIPHLPEYDINDYDLMDNKDFKKYINDIKRFCRNSFEYRQMVKYLRENLDMNKCSFYENVNNIDTTKIKIHIHHDPLTLEDICLIVYNKRSTYGESLEVEMVAKEVMFLHYKLLIGLIPLAETPHELVHNQYLFVPADKVLGHYGKFIDMYEPFMTPEQLYTLNNILEATKTYNGEDLSILNKRYIYLDMTGAYKLPELSLIQELMSRRIEELKSSADIFNQNNNKVVKPIEFVNKEEGV